MNKIMSRDCQLVNQTLSFDEDLGNTGECPSCRKNSLKIAKMPDIGIEVCFCVACDFKGDAFCYYKAKMSCNFEEAYRKLSILAAGKNQLLLLDTMCDDCGQPIAKQFVPTATREPGSLEYVAITSCADDKCIKFQADYQELFNKKRQPND